MKSFVNGKVVMKFFWENILVKVDEVRKVVIREFECLVVVKMVKFMVLLFEEE